MSTNSSIPEVRPFQFEEGGLQNLANSANLFRGDINLAQKLFSLPAKEDQNLTTQVSLLYQSNVYEDATTNNLDSPTSVVGLGWSLPLEYIELLDNESPTPGKWKYQLWSNGVPNELIPEPAPELLTTMDLSSLGTLLNNQAVPSELVAAFSNAGLRIDSSAIAQNEASTDPWVIVDKVNELAYFIEIQGKSAQIQTGGQSFQLISFKFWRITYFSAFERWEIIDENGIISSYGGDQLVNDYTIDWQVAWTDTDQSNTILWKGASSNIQNQTQVASSWRLAHKKNHWDETVNFSYNTDEDRNPLSGVTQKVGANGTTNYTKACYLTAITDAFGRTARFNYKNKLWQSTGDKIQEYSDPYNDDPTQIKNFAWQTQYETLFLDQIVILDTDGKNQLMSVQLEYQPVAGNGQPAANIAPNNTAGNLYKRFLTGITIQNSEGKSAPGLVFDYYFDEQESQASLGALKTATHPLGGTVNYGYQLNKLNIDRQITISSPGDSYSPSVWQGPDYTVVLWKNSDSISLNVYTWNGHWVTWPDNNFNLSDSGSANMEVIANEDFFVVSFFTDELQVWAFQKSAAQSGQWEKVTLDGGIETDPTQTYQGSSEDFQITGGDHFFIVAQQQTYDRFMWDWSTNSWVSKKELPLAQFSIVRAYNEYYLTIDLSSQSVGLNFLSPDQQWTTKSITMDFQDVSNQNVFVDMAESMVAMVFATSVNNPLEYDLYILQWGDDLSLVSSYHNPYVDNLTNNELSSLQPQIIGNSLVSIRDHAVRFDGVNWNSQDFNEDSSAKQQNFSTGPDYIVQTDAQFGTANSYVLGFDPESLTWVNQQITNEDLTNAQGGYWPHVGGTNYLLVGWTLFPRKTSTNWGDAVNTNSPIDLSSHAITATGVSSIQDLELFDQLEVNNDPNFVALLVKNTNNNVYTVLAMTILNGDIDQVEAFSGEQYAITGIGPDTPSFSAGALVTFPVSQTFATASEIILRQYARQSVNDKIDHRSIQKITTSNGFETPATKTYQYDLNTASADTSCSIMKFHQVTIQNIDPSSSTALDGSTVKQYLNAQVTQLVDGNYYDMMDGLEIQVQTYDNKQKSVSNQVSSWVGFNQRALDLQGDQTTYLKGAYVLKSGQSHTVEGVTQTKTIKYTSQGEVPFDSEPKEIANEGHGSGGISQTRTTYHVYGHEVDPTYLNMHLYSALAQKKETWKSASSEEVSTSANATTFGDFNGKKAVEGQFVWKGTNSPDFPFSSYVAGTCPQDWQLENRVAERSDSGKILTSVSGRGIKTSVLVANDTFPVAKIIGSDITNQEALFCAFEPYETVSAFTGPNSQVITEDAAFGTACLQMSKGATFSLDINVTNASETYMIGCWTKALVQKTSDVLDLEITPYVGSQAQPVIRFSVHNDDNIWQHSTFGIPIGNDVSRLHISASSNYKSGVKLDGVTILPIDARLTAKTFDPTFMIPTTIVQKTGNIRRLRYDDFNQKIAETKTDCEISELTTRFLSRSTRDTFNTQSPNSDLQLTSPGGGSLETFNDGGEWQKRWTASNLNDNWKVENGELSHIKSTTDTLQWSGWSSQNIPETAALFFQLRPTSELTDTIQLNFGKGYNIIYDSSGIKLADPTGKTLQSSLMASEACPVSWLLACLPGTVLFFGDGQLLISYDVDYGSASNFELKTGNNQFSIQNLAAIPDPRLTVIYRDGLGRNRQRQEYWKVSNLANTRVDQVVYNPIGKKVARTKRAPGRFGSGEKQHLFGYLPGFVDVGTFLSAPALQMIGDINDYYSSGQSTTSNDEGYPYHGLAYEENPLGRIICNGNPGKEYAFGAENAAFESFEYSSNQGDDAFPAGNYKTTTNTSPTSVETSFLSDFEGQLLASSISQDGTVSSQTQSTINAALGSRSISTNLPNAFAGDGALKNDSFSTQMCVNSIGNKSQQELPSSGSSNYLYDDSGNLRFIGTPFKDATTQWVYQKYDRMGRIIELGTLAGTWSAGSLAPFLDQNNWPSKPTAQVTKVLSYDGDGGTATTLGQLVTSTIYNNSPNQKVDVTETYSYNVQGLNTKVSVSIQGPFLKDASYQIDYNNLGEEQSIIYPEGCSVKTIAYQWNELGQMIAIYADNDNGSQLCQYSYDAEGNVSSEVRNDQDLITNFGYNSANWLTSRNTANKQSQKILNLSYEYYADGKPSSRTISYNEETELKESYVYDGQGRLKSVTVTGDQVGNEQFSSIDPNGNIESVDQDGTTLDFTMASESDRILSMKVGEVDTPISYDADGWVAGYGKLTIDHDLALQRTNEIDTDKSKLTYAYGARLGQVLKQNSKEHSSDQFMVRTVDGRVLAKNTSEAGWIQHVWGAVGLVMADNGEKYFPLNDHMETTLAVLNHFNEIKAKYRYRAFGELIYNESSISNIIGPTFLGQEYDQDSALYNFNARIYDPVSKRFLSPDPAQQFASPYVFVGNDPISLTDPSGELSVWGQALALVGNVVIWAVGAVLAPETGGASLAGAEGATDGLDAGVAVLDGSEEVAEAAAAKTAEKLTGKQLLQQLSSNVVKGAGLSGGLYVVTTPSSDITWSDYGTSVLFGAIGGATDFGLDKGFDELYGSIKSKFPNFAKSIEGKFSENLIKKLAIGFRSAVEADVRTIAKNVGTGHSWNEGLSTGQFFEAGLKGVIIDKVATSAKNSSFLKEVKKGNTNEAGVAGIAGAVVGIGLVSWGGIAGFHVD